MPTKLQRLRINAVGLVDKGDNPDANIVFWKRKPEMSEKTPTVDELQKQLEQEQADHATVAKVADDLKKKVETLESELTALKKPPPDPLEKADPAVKDAVTKLEKAAQEAEERAKKADERLEKVEEANRHAAMVKKVGDLIPKLGKADELATILRKAESSMSEAEQKTFWQTLKAANEQVSQSKLFEELGISGGDEGRSAEEKLDKLTEKILTAEPTLTRGAAYQKALESDEGRRIYGDYAKSHPKQFGEG